MKQPELIHFKKIGSSLEGYISVSESIQNVPFDIQRVFWTYFTPDSVVRGRHAHHQTKMVLIAASGKITVTTQMPNEPTKLWILDQPEIGLYMPPYCWHTMQYSHNAIQLVLASTHYSEDDYIRDYSTFEGLKNDSQIS